MTVKTKHVGWLNNWILRYQRYMSILIRGEWNPRNLKHTYGGLEVQLKKYNEETIINAINSCLEMWLNITIDDTLIHFKCKSFSFKAFETTTNCFSLVFYSLHIGSHCASKLCNLKYYQKFIGCCHLWTIQWYFRSWLTKG